MHEILKAHVNDQVEPREVPRDDLLAGDPLPQSKVLLRVPDDMAGAIGGILSADPGAVQSSLATPETLYVVEGSACIERNSEAAEWHRSPRDRWSLTGTAGATILSVMSPNHARGRCPVSRQATRCDATRARCSRSVAAHHDPPDPSCLPWLPGTSTCKRQELVEAPRSTRRSACRPCNVRDFFLGYHVWRNRD
jgi:hypothetical protein